MSWLHLTSTPSLASTDIHIYWLHLTYTLEAWRHLTYTLKAWRHLTNILTAWLHLTYQCISAPCTAPDFQHHGHLGELQSVASSYMQQVR